MCCLPFFLFSKEWELIVLEIFFNCCTCKRGNPKTLTPVAQIPTTDWSMDYPNRPPLRITPKQFKNNKWRFHLHVWGCLIDYLCRWNFLWLCMEDVFLGHLSLFYICDSAEQVVKRGTSSWTHWGGGGGRSVDWTKWQRGKSTNFEASRRLPGGLVAFHILYSHSKGNGDV